METLVVDPIEEALNELDDVEIVTSSIQTGLTVISVEFDLSTDPDEKFSDVKDAVNGIRSELPDGMYDIQFKQYTSTDANIYQFALVSDEADFYELKHEAERLKSQLERVQNLKTVEIYGEKEEEVCIYLNLEKMSLLNISIDQVDQILSTNNLNIPAGSIDSDSKNLVINTSGNYRNIDEIRDSPVAFHNGHLVYLKDIANVKMTFRTEEYITRKDGKTAIFVAATQKESTNILDISKEVDQLIPQFEHELPSNIALECVFDQADGVKSRINGFLGNLLGGILLVGLTIFIALGFRAASIVMTAVPLSIFIGLAFLDISGFALQQISIAGLVIALGLLVDNAIVVTENITNFRNEGASKLEAAIKGTQQVGWPIVTSTITTLFSFLPLMMMKNQAGQFIQTLPLTVIYTLAASLFVALTLTPLLSKNLIKVKEQKNTKFSMSGVLKRYNKLLKFALKHKIAVVVVTAVIFVASTSLLVIGAIKITFFPVSDSQQFVINVETPSGSNLQATNEALKYVESVLDTLPEIKSYSSNVGNGNPKIFMAQRPVQQLKHKGQIMVTVNDMPYGDIINCHEKLQAFFSVYPYANLEVKSFVIGPPIASPIAIYVTGDDFDEINMVAKNIENKLIDIPGTINITNNSGQSNLVLDVIINKEKANSLGIPIVEIDKTLRTCFEGSQITEYKDQFGENIPVKIKLLTSDSAHTSRIEDFDRIMVRSMSEKFIPLNQVADIKLTNRTSELSHYDSDRSVKIYSNVIEGYSIDEIMKTFKSELQTMDIPSTCNIVYDGAIETRNETYGGMAQAALLAIFLVFSVLVLQFQSFRQPLIIFSAIPLAVIGSIWALLFTDNPFSFSALLGLISLIGIVVNNSIILIDFINKLQSSGVPLYDALVMAGEKRLRPIVLTTLTTIGGLIPLTLFGGLLWSPMGWAIIGGLTVSTFLVLIIVPILYAMMYKNSKHLANNSINN